MSRLFLAAALLSLVLAFACDDETTPVVNRPTSAATTATPEPGSTFIPFTPTAPTPTPRPRPEANPFPDELRAQAAELLARIGEVRGTPARREVEMFLLTREQARDFYLGGGDSDSATDQTPTDSVEGEEEAPPRPFNLRQETYVLLGLVPPPQPRPPSEPGPVTGTLQDQQIDNLISQITGFYSDEFAALYLVENSGGCVRPESTIVHELTHALQYQYRDIDNLVRERAGNWDASRALLTVLEGDAVYTETQVLGFSTRSTCVREPACFQIPAARGASPYVVERELDTWYEDGFCFIQVVHGQLTRGITGIFEDLPTTTEQILHPEKYLEGEAARPVFLNSLIDDLGPGWEQMGRGNFGEFGLQNLLLTGLAGDPTLVQDAAAGWGGDSFFFYQDVEGEQLLHLETRWDTGDEARQFYDALVACMAALAETDGPEDGAALYRTAIGDITWSTTVASDRVTLLVATDASALESAATMVE